MKLTKEDKILIAQILKTATIIGVAIACYHEKKHLGSEIMAFIAKELENIP
jgi:hypothetical protein